MLLYADDTALILSDSTLSKLERNVNLEIKKVATWLNENKLSLNYTKTAYMLITPQKCDDISFKLQISENKKFHQQDVLHDHGVRTEMEFTHSSSLQKT